MPKTKPTQRDAALTQFLANIAARCMWQQHVPMVGRVDCYASNGRVFIVQRFIDRNGTVTGWDVYIPANTDGRIDVTLDALRAYLKL